MRLFRPSLYEPILPMKLSKSESSRCKRDTKGGWREPDQRLQRSPDLPRSRLRRRPDGQERVPHTNCEIYEKKPDHGGAYAGGTVHSADQRIRKKHELSEEITGVRAFLMQK